MSSFWGTNIHLSLFGESHGDAIGITIDGLPAGIEIDFDIVQKELNRRAPSNSISSTGRAEDDRFRVLSGFFNNTTTGAPLCAVIFNKDQNPSDYLEIKDIIRPGHADYTSRVKYSGFNDYRGGGHFSGRLTAPIVFAGAIAKQILYLQNITVGSHIYSIGNIADVPFDNVKIDSSLLEDITNKNFPVISDAQGRKIQDLILEVKQDSDSIGGIIEAAAVNVPAGIGSPFFDSVESTISHLLFSIPSVKGVEFGTGFNISKMKGSQANDEFYIKDESIKTYTNNNGGILGGITNGMPVICRCAIKPTPSIGKKQSTVNMKERCNTQIEVKGRHDSCIVVRAVPVVESCISLALLDLFMDNIKLNI